MDAGERKRLGYMYECRPDSKYCHFLFGLLKDEKLADAIVIIIEKMRFRPLNAFYYSCSQSHLLLYCLSELVGSSMPAKPEDAVIKNCPSNFHLSRECPLSNECFEIMFQLLASEHLKHVELVNNTVSGTRRIAELLTRIADLREQLRGLAISLVIENPDEKEQLERILKNTLFQLRLLKCYFSGEICEALRNCFPKVSLVDGLDGINTCQQMTQPTMFQACIIPANSATLNMRNRIGDQQMYSKCSLMFDAKSILEHLDWDTHRMEMLGLMDFDK
ncbi:hypothetical protein CAPTEDRAFT_204564 [Capitella teleta]|uniref:Uncharacterized protein n=1 Tax=Capitella teleta TaxID=283909 RepID=R7TVT7_CAPTE|nr:hypothetical protein CAPTEDRAFT_204564 [Capitella teleta]|eukprot:ELT98018.1 hypothetical protein CAPTEDRAFT_204564 [Capitella teleta]